MTETNARARDARQGANELDVGRPVEWMVDPTTHAVLGVTYAFSQSDERKSVWYTPNKRKPKSCVTVTSLVGL